MNDARKYRLKISSADDQAEPMDADTPDEGDEVSAEDTGDFSLNKLCEKTTFIYRIHTISSTHSRQAQKGS